jgi:hypothetical protein
MSVASTAVSKFGPDAGKTPGKFFDPNRTYKFRHLQFANIVRDRTDLKIKIERFGFPPGRLPTPRDRQWTGGELNHYLETRPTTQAEMDALPNRAPKTTPNIPKKSPGRARKAAAKSHAA